MRRPQSERVVSLAALGARRGEEAEEEEEVEEADDDDEVALGVETDAAPPFLLVSSGFLLLILPSRAEQEEAITELRGLRAWADAAAARGAGKDMILLSSIALAESDFFSSLSSTSQNCRRRRFVAPSRRAKKAKERRALFLAKMVTFDAELFGSRLGRLYSSWRVRVGFHRRGGSD